MSHTIPTTLGINEADLARRITALVPNYMTAGGAMDEAQMHMPLPENTLPMMTGTGPHGAIEMGGMFTVMKIRPDLAHNDYRDPGWYQAPAGSVARLWEGKAPPVKRGGE
jgi:manganese oxidase